VTHISRVICVEIAKDRLGQPAYETFSIKHSFHLFKFRSLAFKEFFVRGLQTWVPSSQYSHSATQTAASTRDMAPSGVCKYIVSSVSCWDRWA